MNWNKTGKIKAVILALLCLPNLIAPVSVQLDVSPYFGLAAFIFAAIAIPLNVKFLSLLGIRNVAPNWNDSPFKQALSFFQFGAYFFLTNGLAIMIGSVIVNYFLSYAGLLAVCCGIGILTGIWLASRNLTSAGVYDSFNTDKSNTGKP